MQKLGTVNAILDGLEKGEQTLVSSVVLGNEFSGKESYIYSYRHTCCDCHSSYPVSCRGELFTRQQIVLQIKRTFERFS